jgi:nicotinamide mononucleotide transporter
VIEFFSEIGPVEWLAVGLALAFLLLAVRQNIWCWACGAASASIYVFLFASGGLYMQSALQFYYIAMALYGWHSWSAGQGLRGETLSVSRWPLRRHLLALLCVSVLSGMNGWLLRAGGFVNFVDAFVAWASVLTTWMATRKVLENWLYWIVIDIVAAVLYWSSDLKATAVLFVAYAIIAVRGYVSWLADERRAAEVESAISA